MIGPGADGGEEATPAPSSAPGSDPEVHRLLEPRPSSVVCYPKRSFTCWFASVREDTSVLPERTSSIAGVMMPVISDAWSVIGNRKVVFSFTWFVKGDTSIPLAFQAAWALSVPEGIAGKTMAFSPTMFWQSGEARNSTHLAAPGLFFAPTQMESASPLYMLARLPVGPMGVGARPTSMPLEPKMALICQEPLVSMAYL